MAVLLSLLGLLVAHLPRPHFAGGDLEEPAVWHSLLAWAVDRKVVLLTANEHGLSDAVGTLLQLRALGAHSTLVHGTSAGVCAAVYDAIPDGACAWTSWKPPSVRDDWNPGNPRSKLFTARKAIVYRLAVEAGLEVLQTDTDTVWFANPFALFDSPTLRDYDVIVQQDSPLVNAGVLFVRNARNGTGAGWLVSEMLDVVQRFTGDAATLLAAVREVVPAATTVLNKVENEQMHLNDIVASAVLGRRVWSASLHRLYVYDGESCMGRPTCSTAAHEKYRQTERAVRAKGKWRALDFCAADAANPLACAGVKIGASAFTLVDPTMPGAAGRGESQMLLAPTELMAHLMPYRNTVANSRGKRCAALGAGGAADGAAAREARRLRLPTVAMLHLSALSSNKYMRATVLQALGRWDARADAVAARFVPPRFVPRAERALTLTNFDLSEVLNARSSAGGAELVLEPLLRLALLTGRRPALPALPCALKPAPVVRAQVEIIVPNSDCGAPVPGDASRASAANGECPVFTTMDCHMALLSEPELGRLRANLTAGELRVVRIEDLLGDGHSAPDFRSRVESFMSAENSSASLVTLDGGGRPIGELARAVARLPPPPAEREAGVKASASAAQPVVPMMCKAIRRVRRVQPFQSV